MTNTNATATTTGNTVTLRYFAWVREKIGHAEETIAIPAGVVTVAELIEWLKTRNQVYAAAFDKPDVIRTALDQTHARAETKIGSAREIAFFPPVTGG
ncbi:MAG: molybdopterin converting factor subunit 1 [Alphaproteobacteria bacterium]|nr:molybdopterin converting factor subunit 1 [Alphaproteobacteria bacterium]